MHTPKQYKESKLLAQRFYDTLTFLQNKDRKRLFDCNKESGTARKVPFIYKNRYIGLFKRTNYITGFVESNGHPMLISFYNWRRYTPQSNIYLGIRGLSWGIHKAHIVTYLRSMINKYFPGDVFFSFDNYKRIGNNLMTSCHNKPYFDGTRMPSDSPALNDGKGWHWLNKFFPENKNIYIVSFSNGYSQRDQLLYSKNRRDPYRIKGMIDIETNFSRFKMKKLIQFLRIHWDKSKLYYATVNRKAEVYKYHLQLIRALDLRYIKVKKGIRRYMNYHRSIIVDVLSGPASVSHFDMMHYTLKNFVNFKSEYYIDGVRF